MNPQLEITIGVLMIAGFGILLIKTIAEEVGETLHHRYIYNKKKKSIRTLLDSLNETVEKAAKAAEISQKAAKTTS